MDALLDCILLNVNILGNTSPRRCCESQRLGLMIAFYTEASRIFYFGWVGICLQREAGRCSRASSRLLLSHTWLWTFFVRTQMFSVVFMHTHLNWSSASLFFNIISMFSSEFSRMYCFNCKLLRQHQFYKLLLLCTWYRVKTVKKNLNF